jgi:anhydro-N-acetylmuramic acid kinase
VIGLISGTSVDGIDVAVADLRLDGGVVELTPVSTTEVPYDDELRADLVSALPPAASSAEQMCRLDTLVGRAFAAAAVAAGPADLVASLGQTVYHWVEGERCLGTLQLGRSAWIAEATGLPVVADLRVRDVAAGGHGAPLASTLDALWLNDLAASTGAPAAALNIGGIANITVVAPGESPLAYDTGPGNALLDAAVSTLTGGVWTRDTDGEMALRGTARSDVLDVLLADPYYAAPPPKSTGKEHFNGEYLLRATEGLPVLLAEDFLASLVELTAVTIADACRSHGVTTVVGSGGGMRNPALTAALARRLGDVELRGSDDLGLPSDGKEALLAALIGFLTWHGVPGNVPSATGASGPRALGSITPGASPLRLPPPAESPVTGLRVRTTAGGPRARP